MSARFVTLLTASDCALCEHAQQVLDRVGQDFALEVKQVRLDTDRGRALAAAHGVLFAPGVLLDGQTFGHGRLSERKLRRALAAPA